MEDSQMLLSEKPTEGAGAFRPLNAGIKFRGFSHGPYLSR
jgi:hypothetical protein